MPRRSKAALASLEVRREVTDLPRMKSAVTYKGGQIQTVKLGTFMGCPVLKGVFRLNVTFCGGYEASSSQWGSGTKVVGTLGPSCSRGWKVKAQSAAYCTLPRP
jgi:hypothetical protein